MLPGMRVSRRYKMKRFVSLLLVLCLALSITSAALAAGAPRIKKQPVSKAPRKGQIVLEIEADNFDQKESGWRFINPDTGEEFTVIDLKDKVFKKNKFSYKAENKKKRLTLLNVPNDMHGWEVYMHLSGNGYSLDSDHIRIWCYGLKKGEDIVPSTPAPSGTNEGEGASPSAEGGENASPAPDQTIEPIPPKIITVTASRVTLIPLDARGKPLEEQAASSLTFENSGSVAIRSDTPVKYWLINGVRIEPQENVTGFTLKNITEDMTISAKLDRNGANTSDIDPNTLCTVTCKDCVFTYHADGLYTVESGTVPLNAYIIVSVTNTEAAANGYIINDGEPEHAGSASFLLKITGDTKITLPAVKKNTKKK